MKSLTITTGKRAVTTLAAALVAASFVGCAATTSAGTDTDSAAPGGVEGLSTFDEVVAFSEAVDLLPEDVAASGELKAVMNVASAPMQFYAEDNATIIGVNADISRLLGRVLGLEAIVENVQFDGIIPALQAGRYDVAVATMSITPERLEVLDMINYSTAGSSILVQIDNPLGISLETICGRKIAVQQGSIQESKRLPEATQELCLDKGLEAPEAIVLPSEQDSLTQLSSGRVDAVWADAPVLGYAAAQQPDKFEIAQENVNGTTPVGIAADGGSALSPALVAAVEHMVTLPEYADLLEQWGVPNAGIGPDAVELHTS